jgi:hypothetical protein
VAIGLKTSKIFISLNVLNMLRRITMMSEILEMKFLGSKKKCITPVPILPKR